MRKHFALFILLSLSLASHEVLGQKKKRKQASQQNELFAPQTAQAKRKGASVNPIRKGLNLLNFSFEMGTGFFNYNQRLNDVLLVRTETPASLLYLFPIEDSNGTGPYTAFGDWFNNFRQITINQIGPEDIVVRTNSDPIVYESSGSYAPVSLRLSFSIKKPDKLHRKTTGEKRSLDQDLVRIGGGIGFGKIKYKSEFLTARFNETIGDYRLPITEVRQKKLFATVSASVFSYLDFNIFFDLEAGTWQFKAEDFNNEVTTYDPYFSTGLTFEKSFSKYFKVYFRPAVEFRNYQLDNGQIQIPNKLSLISLNLGFLLKYPTYPRNKFKAHHVQMEHVFNGKIYRGRSIFRKQNPRIGQNYKKGRNN